MLNQCSQKMENNMDNYCIIYCQNLRKVFENSETDYILHNSFHSFNSLLRGDRRGALAGAEPRAGAREGGGPREPGVRGPLRVRLCR